MLTPHDFMAAFTVFNPRQFDTSGARKWQPTGNLVFRERCLLKGQNALLDTFLRFSSNSGITTSAAMPGTDDKLMKTASSPGPQKIRTISRRRIEATTMVSSRPLWKAIPKGSNNAKIPTPHHNGVEDFDGTG